MKYEILIYTVGMDLSNISLVDLEELHKRLCLKPECGGFKKSSEEERKRVMDEIRRKIDATNLHRK